MMTPRGARRLHAGVHDDERTANAPCFGPSFFVDQLAAFVRDRCPPPECSFTSDRELGFRQATGPMVIDHGTSSREREPSAPR